MDNQYTHDVFISFAFEDQAIVDKIVNQLTNKYKISCWICTEQIRAGENFRDDIAQAIKAAKIAVLVQSKNSATSKEVAKEILYALKKEKMVKPFIIEESQLSDAMEMELSTTHYIDATKPTLDERIRELAKDICRSLGRTFSENGATDKTADTPTLVSTPNVLPKMIFCGREDVLSEIHQKYQEGEHVLFLHGIGGIGKTQIAKQYIKQHRNEYDTVIYATYQDTLKQMLIAESPFAIEPEMIRYTMSDGMQEDDDEFLTRKIDQIKKLSNEKTLIVLDNFDVEEDESLPLLTDGKYRLLVTSRCDYSRFYPTIEINPLDSMESLKAIFLKNYRNDDFAEDPALVELIELVNRHTYTIELLALHMEKSGQTPDEMIEALKERGLSSLDEKVLTADMKTKNAYENLLKIFKVFSLSEEARQLLMYLSLLPIDGVDVQDFKKWADLKSLRVIRNLENRGWIVRNTGGLALHPIIKSVIMHEIPATEENCGDFLNRFSESIQESRAWHFKKADKDKYGAIAKSLLAVFREITPKTEWFYYNSEVLLSFAVDPQFATELAERLYAYYTQKHNCKCYEVGRSAFKLGWVYAYNTQLPNAIERAFEWLKKAEQILGDAPLKTTDEISKLTQTRVNLAKMYLVLFERTKDKEAYTSAKKYAEFNLEYSSKAYSPGDPHYGKLAGAYWQLADVLLAGGEYESALENIERSLSILIPLNTENNGDTSAAINRKAAILYAMGEYESAKLLAQKSTYRYVEYFGENNPTISKMYTLLGNCCVALGEHMEARTAFEKALEIAEKLYAPGEQQIMKLQKKLGELSVL